MRVALGTLAIVLAVAGCVPATPGSAPMSYSCVTTITGPDGKPQQAVIEADDPAAAALLCEGGAPMAAPIPAPAPVQSRSAKMPGDNPLVHRRAGGPGCGLKMVGGTGYVCASH